MLGFALLDFGHKVRRFFTDPYTTAGDDIVAGLEARTSLSNMESVKVHTTRVDDTESMEEDETEKFSSNELFFGGYPIEVHPKDGDEGEVRFAPGFEPGGKLHELMEDVGELCISPEFHEQSREWLESLGINPNSPEMEKLFLSDVQIAKKKKAREGGDA